MIMPTMTRPALSAEQAAKVQRCLDLLEQAQHLCDLAAQALCPVPGFGDQWSHLVGYDAVKGDWHLVAGRRAELFDNARRGLCPCCALRLPDEAAGCCPRCGFDWPAA